MKNIQPPPLNLQSLEGLLLHPKDTLQYLKFYFDKKLSFP